MHHPTRSTSVTASHRLAFLSEPDSHELFNVVDALSRDQTISQGYLEFVNDFLDKCIHAPSTLSGSLPAPLKKHAPYASLDKYLSMTLCGEVITYDLDLLEPDPQAIITLLKLTSSERGDWMIIAGHYRRTGHYRAAILAMMAMLHGNGFFTALDSAGYNCSLFTAMQAHGIVDDDVKPAFVMLAACELDLSKQVHSVNKVQHVHQAHYWLRKAFPLEHYPPAITLTPMKETTLTPAQHVATAQANQSNHTFVDKPQECETSPSAHASRQEYSHVRILEREVRALRDRLDRQACFLDDSRVIKHKLEDQLSEQRERCRRLENRVHTLQHDVEVSRRAELYALEGQRRESGLRRQAEERASSEQEKRIRLQEESNEANGRSKLLDLANMLQKVADTYV